MKSYWHLSYLTKIENEISLGYMIRSCDTEYFNFADFYLQYPQYIILNVNEINIEQCMALEKFIQSRNGETKGDESES